MSNEDQIQSQVLLLQTAIEHRFSSSYVHDDILRLPRRKHSSPSPATDIARLLFPDHSQIKADIQYEIALSHARRVVRQRKELAAVRQRNLANDSISQVTQSPWKGQEEDAVSLEGPSAIPMPVEIGSFEDFKDVFEFLHRNVDPKDMLSPEKRDVRDEHSSIFGLEHGHELKWKTPLVEFKRGVVYDDGRLDLCKMVVGPTHIEKLLDSLEQNTVIVQFLLGNNIIGSTGARRIAKFIHDHPDRIETWYIAGNDIHAQDFQLLVDAMIQSPRITNIWLKRNPLSLESANNIIRLITQTPNLRTLDLENTELGDEGVSIVLAAITGRTVPLRHLYLNANGMGEKAAKALADCLAHPASKLASLFLASNPIGDAGALFLAEALEINTTLYRLSMGSTGLTSTGIAALSKALSTHPRIMSVDFGAPPTTHVHGQRFNHLADEALPEVISLIKNPSLRNLELGRTSLSVEGTELLKQGIVDSSLCHYAGFRIRSPGEPSTCSLAVRRALENNVKKFFPEERDYDSFVNGLGLRFIYSPPDVRLIDSVYRTRQQGN